MEHPLDYARDGDDNGLNEEKFIAGYMALTGASQSQARNVYMFTDALRGHDGPQVNGGVRQPERVPDRKDRDEATAR